MAIEAVVNDAIPAAESVASERHRALHLDVEGAGSPSGAVLPAFRGQFYFRTSDSTYWMSTGLINTDWKQITN